MNIEPIWIMQDVVLSIHKRQISEHGGSEGVRDLGLLESALDRPKNLYFYSNPKPNIEKMAASYAYGIVKNHPFIDGNKRVAYVTSQLFLRLNNRKLASVSSLSKYKTFIALANGTLLEKGF